MHFPTLSCAVSFVMRAYVVVPKLPLAYAAIGFLSLVGIMAVILDVVRVSRVNKWKHDIFIFGLQVQTVQMSCTATSDPL
jgi:hypothetical protein